MDYYLLTDLAARVGYHLALSGAETFRVEETIRRLPVPTGHRLQFHCTAVQ